MYAVAELRRIVCSSTRSPSRAWETCISAPRVLLAVWNPLKSVCVAFTPTEEDVKVPDCDVLDCVAGVAGLALGVALGCPTAGGIPALGLAAPLGEVAE